MPGRYPTPCPASREVPLTRPFSALWSQLFPAEQARIIQLLVRSITVTAAGLEVDIRREGIAGVVREIVTPRRVEAAE